MNKKMCNIFMFLAGAAVGSVGTWLAVKGKYAKIAQEEIDSVKEAFSRRDSNSDKKRGSEDDDEYDTVKEYEKQVSAYTTAAENNTESGENDTDDRGKPYIISPEEFGEEGEYDTVNLTYYADGVLADEDDEEIDDVDGTVGSESLKSFGEYDDDAVHVRNDMTQCYYEILRDSRTYQEVTGYTPYGAKLEE